MTTKRTKPLQCSSLQRFIFVVGNNRCGTTMMRRILENHPDIFGLREIGFFERLWSPERHAHILPVLEAKNLAAKLLCLQRCGKLFNEDDLKRHSSEAEEIIDGMQSEALTSINIYRAFLLHETLRNNKTIACEKSPRNVFYVKELLAFFPNSRVINMVRDPRDVLLSQKNHWRRRYLGAKHRPISVTIGAWINYHPRTISKLWNACVSSADSFSADNRVLTIRFEDLLGEPAGTVRKVCNFIRIPYSDDLLKIPQIGSSTESDRPEQKGINPRRWQSWRKSGLNSAEIYICQKISSSLMNRHGYKPIQIDPKPMELIYYTFSFALQFPIASFLFLRKVKSIPETVRRLSV